MYFYNKLQNFKLFEFYDEFISLFSKISTIFFTIYFLFVFFKSFNSKHRKCFPLL